MVKSPRYKRQNNPMRSRMPTILVTNDDGFLHEGIQALAKALRKIAHVVVVAPDREQSGSSHSLTLQRPLRFYNHSKTEFSVDGTPADCIMIAVYTILKRKPDLIVSGINPGVNVGDDVHYSGTVSAAVEGAMMDIPSVAVSLVTWPGEHFYYETATLFITKLGRKILSRGQKTPLLPKGTLLNVNVPNVPPQLVRSYRFTKLGKRNYGSAMVENTDPRGRKYYWIGGEGRTVKNISGSDGNAIQEKEISVTPLQVDMTYYPLLEEMANWKL